MRIRSALLLLLVSLVPISTALADDFSCSAKFQQDTISMAKDFTLAPSQVTRETFMDDKTDLAVLAAEFRRGSGYLQGKLRTWSNFGLREVTVKGNVRSLLLSLQRPSKELAAATCAADKPKNPIGKLYCKVTFFLGTPLHEFQLEPGQKVEDLPMKGFDADQGRLTCEMSEELTTCHLRHFDGSTGVTTFVNHVRLNSDINSFEIISDSFGGTHRISCNNLPN